MQKHVTELKVTILETKNPENNLKEVILILNEPRRHSAL